MTEPDDSRVSSPDNYTFMGVIVKSDKEQLLTHLLV